MALLEDNPQPEPKPSSTPLQRLLPFTTVALIIAVLYAGWTLYSRHASNVEAVERIEAEKEAARKKQTELIFGSGEIRFSNFSINRSHLKAGETAQLCYGVMNAKSVKLDPPVENIKPSYNHCLDIAPKTTTTYTITADDGAGHTKSESLRLPVE